MKSKRIQISGWSEQDDKAIESVYPKLLAKGLPVAHNGEPNVSAILLYLLKQEALRIKKNG